MDITKENALQYKLDTLLLLKDGYSSITVSLEYGRMFDCLLETYSALQEINCALFCRLNCVQLLSH